MGTPAGGSGFATALLINFIIFLIVLIIFNVLRRWNLTSKFYTPKRYFKVDNRRKPKRLPTFLWTWFVPLFNGTYSEKDLYEIAGFDAVMYFKFLRMALEIFVFILLWVFIVVVPTNRQGGVNNTKTVNGTINQRWQQCLLNNGQNITDLSINCTDRLFIISLSNIDQKNKRLLWVHLISVYVISFFLYYILYFYNKQAVKLRFKYLASADQGAESRTALITDIPEIAIGQPVYRAFQLANTRLFFFVPRGVRNKMEKQINKLLDSATGKVSADSNEESQPYKKVNALPEDEEEQYGDAHEEFKRDSIKSDQEQMKGEDKGGKEGTSKDTQKGTGKYKSQIGTLKNIILKKDDDQDQFINYGIKTDIRARKLFQSGMNAQQVVDQEMRMAFPDGAVDQVNMIYDQEELGKTFEQYKSTQVKLEDLIDLYTSLRRRGKVIKRQKTPIVPLIAGPWAVEKYGKKPLKVDALEYNTLLLDKLYEKLLEEQKISKQRPTSSAFVTFTKRWYRTVAVNSLFCQNEQHWKLTSAPNPKEIEWNNLFIQSWERLLRQVFSWTVFFFMTIFYGIPVGGINVIITYIKNLKSAKALLQNSIFNALLSGLLPQLALIIFLALVPIVLRILARIEGITSKSQIDFAVIKKYFLFQIVIVFIIQLVSQNLFDTIKQSISNPAGIFMLLGGQAPASGNYFANYIVTQALNVQPIGFMRIVGLVIFLLRTLLASTDRSKRKIWQNYRMRYADYVVNNMIALMLGLIYCIIQPIILPICFIYFLICNVVWRYNLLYVFREEYQSGGLLWPLLHDQVIISLAIFQIIMVGYFIINAFAAAALVVIPLVLTFIYYLVIARSYDRPVKTLSLIGSQRLDKDDNIRQQELVDQGKGDLIYEDFDYYYMSPCFKILPEEHTSNIKEATNMDRVLNGENIENLEEDQDKNQNDTYLDTEEGANEPDYYYKKDDKNKIQQVDALFGRII